jgi:hypothetical protein
MVTGQNDLFLQYYRITATIKEQFSIWRNTAGNCTLYIGIFID